jgi:hypothetical protein
MRLNPAFRVLSVPAVAAVSVTVLALLATTGRGAAQDHAHHGDPAQLGTVSFPTSCAAAVQPQIERAVAMLHSFWFEAAEAEFDAVLAAAPSCAIAHWGRAITMMGNPMTRAAPPATALAAGHAAAQRAHELAASASPRERAYAAAALAYYRDHDTRSHAERMRELERAFDAVRQAHPDDMEATIFYARTVVANAPPDDATFARLLHAAELMEPLLETHADHPGLAHYLIHAYDVPQLADRGTSAAMRYASIAPAAPHALHMPSHIFTRLGYWDESIETNARSAAAEPDSNAAVHPMDYMVYAFLQQGRDADAHAVVARAVQNPERFYGGLLGYNFAAMPARFALERNAWSDAAALHVPTNAPAFVEAVTRFARAVGIARGGMADAAQFEIQALAQLRDRLTADGDRYWSTVVEAQRLAAAAWIARAAGDTDSAVRLAREAADLEETVEKHPVTPGPILPARELEGDLLMELGRAADAQRAYEATLKREPRRARALYGAARAAEAAGRTDAATAHYRELAQLMDRADAGRPEAAAAQRFLANRR